MNASQTSRTTWQLVALFLISSVVWLGFFGWLTFFASLLSFATGLLCGLFAMAYASMHVLAGREGWERVRDFLTKGTADLEKKQ